jgi:signal transduction histidine kinase
VIHLVDWEANRAHTSTEFIAAVMAHVCKYLNCGEASVLLLDQARTSLEQQTPRPGPALRVPLSATEDPIVQVWRGHFALNSGTLAPGARPEGDSTLIMPIYQQRLPLAEPRGVIRCRRKIPPESTVHGFDSDFSVTDEIILDAVQTALVPHLDRMISAETRAITMRRIKHELQGPLTVMRGATKYAMVELQTRGLALSEDYLGECRSYISLMEQIVAKAGFLRPEIGLVLQPTRVLLFKDVIVPAVEAMEVYLEDRGFSNKSFDFGNITQMPALYVDKARFQQVVFNLLSNAVKYSDSAPHEFRVRVFAEQQPPQIKLVFQDWGTGIPDGMAETIFLEGVRGPNAFEHNVSGDGIGLWMVREIIRAHGGTIKVTRSRAPTEFTIFLPASLQMPTFQRTK